MKFSGKSEKSKEGGGLPFLQVLISLLKKKKSYNNKFFWSFFWSFLVAYISDDLQATAKAKSIASFWDNSFSDESSFEGNSFKYLRATATAQIKTYFGFGGLLL